MPRKTNPHSVPYIKPDFHSQNKEKQRLHEEEEMHLRKTKKHRLRSSLDIYNRLMHDQTLNMDLKRVVIGYSDHILGDQEMCVLDWKMIEKGGDIPMHHILYFSLILNNGNKLILWHKKTKLDRLYGSGVTKPNQRIDKMLNSKKIKNIQSQNPIKHDNECKQNDDDRKITQIPKRMKQTNDMIQKYFPRYPIITKDGFVESFQIDQSEKWLKYLDFYGCVVLKVLNEEEVEQSVNEMFDEIYARTCELNPHKKDIHKIDINNPFTWTEQNWPNPKWKFLTDRPAFSKQAFMNRCSEKMHFIFSQIYKDTKLNVTIDNWGIQRGTKDLKFINPANGQEVLNGNIYNSEQKKWRRNLQPHWDINPWSYVEWIECGHYENIYQGALALSEQRIEDGTHLTLPCGTRYLPKWCEMHKNENKNPHRHTLNANSKLIKCMQPIPLRKGEMIIWNYGQCHANTKNYSNRMRLCQYIRMFPAKQKYIKRDHYSAQAILEQYKQQIDMRKILGKNMDERTKKLLGLGSW